MKNSNRLIILFLTLILLFTLSACSNDSAEPNNQTVDDVTPVVTDTVNTADTVTDITPAPEDEFSLTDFIGSWASGSDSDSLAIIIDSEYKWVACTRDEVFSVGYIAVEGDRINLYRNSDDARYCSLVYSDNAVTNEFGDVFNYAGPVEEYIPEGYIDVFQLSDSSEYSLLLGKYYCSEDDGSYIELSEGLNFEMYAYSDGSLTLLDSGYLEKIDDAGFYTVYPTLYIDEEPYEIFEFDTGVLSWNGFMYYYSDEEPSVTEDETAYTLLPGTYFCIDEDSQNYYIVITEDLQYESYGPTDFSDELSVFDDGYITATDEAGVYIKNPTMYITDEPMEIYVTEDGLLQWGLSTYEHGSDSAEY